MAEDVRIDQVEVAEDLTGAHVLGYDKDYKTKVFPLQDIVRSEKGIAYPNTVPAGDRFAGETWDIDTASYGQTFTGFGNINVPAIVNGKNIANAKFKWNNGAWVLQYEFVPDVNLVDYAKTNEVAPLKKVVSNLSESIVQSNGDTNFVSEDGNIGMILSRYGELIVRYLKGAWTVTSDTVNNVTFAQPPKGYLFVIRDESGNIAFAIKENGDIISTENIAPRLTGYLADIVAYFTYGQSLSVGSGSSPALTTTSEPYILGFTKGPRMEDFDDDPSRFNALIPLVETGNSGNLETPCSTLARSIKKSIEADGITINNTDFRYEILSCGAGYPAAMIQELSKGTSNYQRLLDCITAGRDLSHAAGKTFNFGGLLWMQGEGNIFAQTAEYLTLLRQLFDDINRDAKAITGQKNDVVFVTYQTAMHNAAASGAGAPPRIALALLEASLKWRDTFFGTAMYQLTYQADNVHLPNTETMKVGALAGYVMKKIAIDGVDWKPIHVVSSSYFGNTIELKFHVPHGKLVFDTDQVTNPGNYGFRLFSGTTERTIISVEIVRPDTIRIVASTTVSGGLKVTYAVNGSAGKTGRTEGSRGCLRDNQGDTNKYDINGTLYPLHNWAPIFEYTI